MSNMNYRLARINVAEGRRAVGMLQMAIAAGLDPVVAITHLRRIASSMLSRKASRRVSRELTFDQLDGS